MNAVTTPAPEFEYLSTAELLREPEGCLRMFALPVIEVTVRRDRIGQWATVSRTLRARDLDGLPSVRIGHAREAVR